MSARQDIRGEEGVFENRDSHVEQENVCSITKDSLEEIRGRGVDLDKVIQDCEFVVSKRSKMQGTQQRLTFAAVMSSATVQVELKICVSSSYVSKAGGASEHGEIGGPSLDNPWKELLHEARGTARDSNLFYFMGNRAVGEDSFEVDLGWRVPPAKAITYRFDAKGRSQVSSWGAGWLGGYGNEAFDQGIWADCKVPCEEEEDGAVEDADGSYDGVALINCGLVVVPCEVHYYSEEDGGSEADQDERSLRWGLV